MVRHLTIKISEDYRIKFERKNREFDLGYSSFPEFIKDCMRRRFEEIEQLKQASKESEVHVST